MAKLILGPWLLVFLRGLAKTRRSLRLISPFISLEGLEPVLRKVKTGISVKLITRLYDRDFLSGVSDIGALQNLSIAGGEICVQNRRLHAKVYIFDESVAVVTSSNLSSSGFNHNAEVGVVLDDKASVQQLVKHYDSVWAKLCPPLTEVRLKEAAEHIQKLKLITTGKRKEPPGIEDHGKDLNIGRKPRRQASRRPGGKSAPPPPRDSKIQKRHFWIKFLWKRGKGEASPTEPVHTYGENQCAITFPASPGRPHQFKAGDIVYETALTRRKRGSDWVVFAKGKVACEHRPGIDELPQETRRRYPSAGRYPFLIWLSDVDLIGKNLTHGVSLYELFDEIGDNTFVWSQHRAAHGQPNKEIEAIRYHRSHIELTPEAAALLDDKLAQAFAKAGKIHLESGNGVWWNNDITDRRLKFRKVEFDRV
jgi:hypothetical protein